MSDQVVNTPPVETPVASTETNQTQSEVKAGEQTPAAKAAEQKAIQKQLEKLKIKFNGKEEEVEYDPSDKEFLAKQFQMAKLGTTNAQERAMLEKQVNAFINELRQNPRKVLTDPNLGVDIKKLVNDYVQEQLENSKKSPEQLEKERLQQELKELKDKQKLEEEQRRQRDFERLQKDAEERYERQMMSAIEKSDLPQSPYVVKKMADYMLVGLQNGVELSAEDVLPLVREEIQADLKQMFSVMPEAAIEQFMGKDIISKLRKQNIAKAKAASIPVKKGVDVAAGSKKQEKSEKLSYKKFFGV